MLAYTDSKENQTTLVLIHGYCETKNLWNDFIKIITPYFRVICIDLPGCGESPNITQATIELSDFADQIHQTLQSIGVQKYCMVGHSLGGYVTLAYAKKYTSYLNGIGLFHSTAFEDDEAKKEVRIKAAEFVREHGARAFVAPMIANLFDETNREQHRGIINRIIKEAEKEDVESIAKTSLAMRAREDSSELISALNIPVLFIVGKKDVAVPLTKSIEQCHLPKDAHVYFFENVGHMGMFEETTKCQQVILNFLTYCSNR
ncbi:alpha/beta fold hydrolase [Flammeovirga agarivorans]|uniref:Alpha/beta hydrolase n=1 Tax=Flammeovirga agarivorans TaxID=2726742 RepID=A0A7X8XZ05_9BACT|nr:alpha/beta hydrolase [Flammeovirga agarivorans]NLR94714.1 alpha/beta hydrolase [Flammeovirga agarivorans]